MKTRLYRSPLVFILLSLPFLGGAGDCGGGDPVDCVCTEIFQPVCASDGRTYGNTCEAECSGLTVASQGECDFTTTGSGESCVGDPTFDECNTGQTCIVFTSLAGQTMGQCHIDCDAPGEGSAICPGGLQCHVVADGPGSICAPQ